MSEEWKEYFVPVNIDESTYIWHVAYSDKDKTIKSFETKNATNNELVGDDKGFLTKLDFVNKDFRQALLMYLQTQNNHSSEPECKCYSPSMHDLNCKYKIWRDSQRKRYNYM
jgi:hypothetical protein